MSASSLSKIHRHLGKRAAAAGPKKQRPKYDWRMLVLLPVWVAAAYIVSNLAVLAIMSLLAWLNMPLENFLRPAVIQTTIAALIYTLTIGIVLGVPYIWQRTTTKKELGITRLPSWVDIGLAPVGFIVYTISVTLILAGIVAWIPHFPIDQAQNVGFEAFGTRTDNILAFVTLVILAPLAEELLFRGYLFGKLKKYVPTLVAVIVTSLLFGLAHFQLNVGIDVFILSLVLCTLRVLTGSIWAGVLVHVIKNALAYYLLFIAPLAGS